MTKDRKFNVVQEVGHFKIEARNSETGNREFRIRSGNKVLARHPNLMLALEDASAMLEAHWNNIGKQLADQS